jgi:hypothetical protein
MLKNARCLNRRSDSSLRSVSRSKINSVHGEPLPSLSGTASVSKYRSGSRSLCSKDYFYLCSDSTSQTISGELFYSISCYENGFR